MKQIEQELRGINTAVLAMQSLMTDYVMYLIDQVEQLNYGKGATVRYKCSVCKSDDLQFGLDREDSQVKFCSRKYGQEYVQMKRARSYEEDDEENERFYFRDDLVRWILTPPCNRGMLAMNQQEFGDRNMTPEGAEYLLIQRSRNYLDDRMMNGFAVQAIGVREQYRRMGVATDMIRTVERTAEEAGAEYVLIQSIMGEGMRELAESLGYVKKMGSRDYYKLL